MYILQWFMDFHTLVLIIVAGLHVGLLGFFGWDLLGYVFGSYVRYASLYIGLSAVWQISRQRFI
jgi:uncharacterized membrane protein YuzA (DUF378 family)